MSGRVRSPKKRDWRSIAFRTKDKVSRNNTSIVAAGVAFYGLLSVPFILTAIVSIYGIIADPTQVQQQIQALSGLLPPEALAIISKQLNGISGQAGGTLSFALVGSILLALWSGSKGMKALMTALGIAYDEPEQRGFIQLNFMAVLLTFSVVLAAIVAVFCIVGIPILLGAIGFSEEARTWTNILRWPLLAGGALVGLAALYRFGPSHKEPRWQWVSPGAILATALWLLSAVLFSWYVSSFGNYNEVYGSLGAVVILLMWLYLSTFIVLLGAAVNSEIEHQGGEGAAKESTSMKVVGQKGAGESASEKILEKMPTFSTERSTEKELEKFKQEEKRHIRKIR